MSNRLYVKKQYVNESILTHKIRCILTRADRYAPNSNFYLTNKDKVKFEMILRAFMIETGMVAPVDQGYLNEGLPGKVKEFK